MKLCLPKDLKVGDHVQARGHAACGLDTCINQDGVCMRCLWKVKEACDAAVRCTAVLNSLLSHVDPGLCRALYDDIHNSISHVRTVLYSGHHNTQTERDSCPNTPCSRSQKERERTTTDHMTLDCMQSQIRTTYLEPFVTVSDVRSVTLIKGISASRFKLTAGKARETGTVPATEKPTSDGAMAAAGAEIDPAQIGVQRGSGKWSWHKRHPSCIAKMTRTRRALFLTNYFNNHPSPPRRLTDCVSHWDYLAYGTALHTVITCATAPHSRQAQGCYTLRYVPA